MIIPGNGAPGGRRGRGEANGERKVSVMDLSLAPRAIGKPRDLKGDLASS